LITQGRIKAAEAGRAGIGIPLLMDLYPLDGVYAILSERHIRVPEESFRFSLP
jgi:hypothetical protein